MEWQCRGWSKLSKVDEYDRIVPTSTWEHLCLRRFGPHHSTFVTATVRPAEREPWSGRWYWQVKVPYREVDWGQTADREQAMQQADKALRKAKAREAATAMYWGRR
jgi:hypothetical protein